MVTDKWSDDYDAHLEDMASAIGHVVLSHNSMQVALLQVAACVWDQTESREIAELFGRRSVDERLKMLGQQLNSNKAVSAAWADRLDRLLNTCRHLNTARNELVHSLNSLADDQVQEIGACCSVRETFDFEAALLLSDELDAMASALLAMCARPNQ